MTISPLTVYLVMQADSFVNAMQILGTIFGVAGFFSTLMRVLGADDFGPPTVQLLGKWAPRLVIAALFSMLLTALVPSTKTLAAMIVVPAIVNSDAIQKDVPEIYELAKDRLKEALK